MSDDEDEVCVCSTGRTCWADEHEPQPCPCCLGVDEHTALCVLTGPDEFVIEDGTNVMRPVRADDYMWP